MKFRSIARQLALAAGIASLAAMTGASSASAQGLFGWLQGEGGREVVSFNQSYAPGQLVVSFGDKRIYHIVSRGKAVSYPIAIPRDQDRWSGSTVVSMKRVNPSWTPTPHMRAENPRLPTFVPGGHPQNPLGVRAMYLGSSAYRIHGTDAPWTIGQNVSKGCIRMYNDDVVELYNKIPVGTKVTVTYQRFRG